MKTLLNISRLCAACLLAFALLIPLTGCGGKESAMGVTNYSPTSLHCLKIGRQYAALGRYELAKEQYLMALVSSNDHELRGVITQELAAVDLMIQTQR